MKKHFKKLLAFIFIFYVSCSDNKNKGRLCYDSNTENPYWRATGAVIKFENAHSGNYVSKINKDNPFSLNFEAKAKEISDKSLSKAKLSAWIMLTSFDSEQNLVFEIRDSTGEKTLEWLNINAADYIENLNQWVKIDHLVDLTISNRNNKEYFYRAYAANGKEHAVYVDDFELEFE